MGTVRPHTMPEGGKVSQEWLAAGLLQVDHTYERPLSERKVRKIMAEFDPDLLGTLEVSRRDDGDDVVLDGQHRREAVVRLWSSKEKLPCLVHHGLSPQDEARVFAGINRARTKPRPLDLHKADVAQGDIVAVEIEKILAARRVTLGLRPSPTTITAVASVYRVFGSGGGDVLDLTLTLIVESSIASEGSAVPAELIVGLGHLLSMYGHRLDRKRLRETLEGIVPRRIIAEARARKADVASRADQLGVVVAMLLLGAYNRGRRGGRIEWVQPTGRNFWKRVDE